jgi:hypothetical protein
LRNFPRRFNGICLCVTLSILTACGGSSSGNIQPVTETPDFSISLTSAQAWSGGATGSASYAVSLSPTGGFTGTMDLAATGLPSGVTSSFSPASVSTSGNSTLTLSGTKPADKTYPFTITASSGSLSHSVNATLVVPGPVATNSLIPPGALSGPDAAAIQQYIISNPVVAGGTFQVEWSAIDSGSGYNWAYSDNYYNTFSAAGKSVNFVFWANADSSETNCAADGQYGLDNSGNCAIPAYVWTALTSANYTTCTPANTNGPQQIPNYFDSAFQTNYQKFIAAAVAHYGSGNFPKVGYIRFGLGHGGETIPVGDWNSGDACATQLASWGVTIPTWITYLTGMLTFEHSLASPVQLMVGITPMGGNQVPDAVAAAAVPLNIGFGSQGLESSDVNNCAGSEADWCNLFNTYFNSYPGNAPLELQTLLQSCPDNSCTTGSLVNLLPFAVANHVTILEIYYQDWLTGYDPNYPGYTQTYQTVLQNTATGQ